MPEQEASPNHDTLCGLCVEFAADAEQPNFTGTADEWPTVYSARWRNVSKNHPHFRHYNTFDELVASAKSGCALCCLLVDDFGPGGANGDGCLSLHLFFRTRPSKFLATFEKDKAAWWYFGRWEPHVFNLVKHRPYDPLKESAVDAEANEIGTPDRFHRAIPADSGSQDAFDTARLWLKACISSHLACSRQPHSQLPTRVVYVGEAPNYNDTPTLFISTPGQSGSYVALSHCWGGNIPCKLTEALLEEYKQGLPVDRLPHNFRDAIRVTRELGFSYIWIDALCIVQDSTADWLAEASKMASFYSQATVTISALDSEGSTTGFLRRRRRRHVKIGHDLSVCAEELKVAEILDRCALDNRGWCMQERLLSPTLLHFSDEQLMWECQQGIFLEQSGMAAHVGSDKQNLNDHPTTKFIKLRREYNFGSISPGACAWYELVEEFSSRNLTLETDILPAIAGAASRFRTLADKENIKKSAYMAGLWESDLRRGLFWGAGSQSDWRTYTIAKYNFDPLSRPESRAARIPSWSWASVQGRVEFPQRLMHMTADNWRDFEILSVDIKVGYDDLMVTEVRGELRIRAPLVRVRYEAPKSETRCGSLFFYQRGDSHQLEEFQISDMNPVMDSQQLESRDCWLLSSSGPPHTPCILLLEEITEGRFRRLGYVPAYTTFREEDWPRFEPVEMTLV